MSTSAKPDFKPDVAALITGAAALAIIGMGITSAGANEGSLKSIATAPSITCANGAEADAKVFNATQFVGLSAVDIVHNYVAKTAGWTHDNVNPAYTQAETLDLGTAEVTQVEVRDNALRRIGVFVVSAGDNGSSYLSRAFTCSSPVVTVAPGFAVNTSNA